MGLDGVLLGLAAPLAFAALWVLFGALRRRRQGDTPYCGECDYALTGLSTSGNCPECGASLWVDGAVVVGEVVSQRRRAAIGWVMLLAAMGCAGAWVARAASDVAWVEYRPFAWLLRDLDRSAELSGPAWDELKRRWDQHELSAAQSTQLVERLLTEQVAKGAPPHPQLTPMMALLESAYCGSRMSKGQGQRFMAAATEAKLVVVPDPVGAGEPPIVRVLCEGNGPGRDASLVRTTMFDVIEWDHHRAGTEAMAAIYAPLGAPRRETIPLPQKPALTAGHHTLRVVLATTVVPVNGESSQRPYRRTQELSVEFDVPEPPAPVKWQFAPQPWLMRLCIVPGKFTATVGDGTTAIHGSLHVTRPAVNLALQVYARVGGHYLPLGKLWVPHDTTADVALDARDLELASVPRTMDLYLVSTEAAARAGRPAFTEAWRGAFDVRNVVVTVVPAATTGP